MDDWDALFLTERQLRNRFEAFAKSDRSLDAYADYSLLALNIQPRFGGVAGTGVDIKPYISRKQSLRLAWHRYVHSYIERLGTPLQETLFLPRLASGKRIGTYAHLRGDSRFHSSVRAETHEEGFRLWGNTVAQFYAGTRSLLLLTAYLNKQVRKFVVDGVAIPTNYKAEGSKQLIELRGTLVPPYALLADESYGPSLPDTTRWEAFRWG